MIGNGTDMTKWRLEELEAVINEFDSVMAEAINQKLALAQNYKNIIATTVGKTIVTIREVICLVKSGFPDGALSLARNLYEQMVVIAFLENHKQDSDFQEYIDDYYTDYELQRYRALIYEAEHGLFEDAQKSELEKERAEAIDAAHRSVKSGNYWWTGKCSFNNLEKDMMESQTDEQFQKFLAVLHMLYLRACISLHASSIGNQLRLGNDPDFIGIDTQPTNKGHEVPLNLATTSLIMIVGITCGVFDIDGSDLTKKLNELALYYSDPPKIRDN